MTGIGTRLRKLEGSAGINAGRYFVMRVQHGELVERVTDHLQSLGHVFDDARDSLIFSNRWEGTGIDLVSVWDK